MRFVILVFACSLTANTILWLAGIEDLWVSVLVIAAIVVLLMLMEHRTFTK